MRGPRGEGGGGEAGSNRNDKRELARAEKVLKKDGQAAQNFYCSIIIFTHPHRSSTEAEVEVRHAYPHHTVVVIFALFNYSNPLHLLVFTPS